MKFKNSILKSVIFLILLAAAITFSGCAKRQQNVQEPPKDNTSAGNGIQDPGNGIQKPGKDQIQEPVKEPVSEIDPVKEQIKNMTINEKIGQLLIVGFEGLTIDDSTASMIADKHVGGLILFGRNVNNPEQLLSLVNSLKKTNSKNNIPLFISVDEEGGRVSRMPPVIKKLPDNQTIGKINNSEFSYKIGGILSDETKAFGFNMDFAPVLDVNSNPDNPVIGDRSFGSKAEIVSKLGIQTMKGIQAGGIIPVVKHFPGHGDTSVDSHVGLPSVNHDMNRLNSLELVPFKAAIDNQADAVMIAHILMNKIDPQNPASLSKAVITDILRKQLNFNGVVITDDMTMGAIMKNYDIGDAAVKAVNAGADIVLVCHGYDNETAVFDAMKKAVNNGVLSKERLDESIYRILKLKQKYKIADTVTTSIDIEKINSKINTALNTYIH